MAPQVSTLPGLEKRAFDPGRQEPETAAYYVVTRAVTAQRNHPRQVIAWRRNLETRAEAELALSALPQSWGRSFDRSTLDEPRTDMSFGDSPVSSGELGQMSRPWSGPCEAMFRYLAKHAPRQLADWVTSQKLSPADLSFAAEALGLIQEHTLAVRALIPLLEHGSAVVREGAVYGLIPHVPSSENANRALHRASTNDASMSVREAATEALQNEE